ncbi:Response regulator receiver modulated diguanylate cyclase [Burkholderiales bacterium 8X]|nr:Response regulator receiver modulated diguanylate cyclase [Burkholderiales bacterium 8X]
MRKSISEASLLLVDDDPTIIQLLSRILSNYSSVRFATTGADALRLAREDPPDLILLDAQMGDMSGLQVCEALKADEALAGVPVIFVSSHQEAELEVAVLKMGAVDFIRKPFNASQVTARVNTQLQLKRLADDLRKQSRVDGDTGLGNQAACDQMLLRELARAHEAGQSICFALVDIDFSKSYESLYGPNLAQASIAAVAETLRRNARRAGDYVARLARDKFALILPDTDAEGGLHVVHRVLDAVEALDISHQGSSVSRHLTCSAGVACLAAPAAGAADASELLSRAAADALSQAKLGGRAQAVLASPEAPGADPLLLP